MALGGVSDCARLVGVVEHIELVAVVKRPRYELRRETLVVEQYVTHHAKVKVYLRIKRRRSSIDVVLNSLKELSICKSNVLFGSVVRRVDGNHLATSKKVVGNKKSWIPPDLKHAMTSQFSCNEGLVILEGPTHVSRYETMPKLPLPLLEVVSMEHLNKAVLEDFLGEDVSYCHFSSRQG